MIIAGYFLERMGLFCILLKRVDFEVSLKLFVYSYVDMGKGAQKDPVSIDEIQKDHVRKEIVASKHWASKFQYYKDENIKVRFIALQKLIHDLKDARRYEGSSS